MAVTEIDDRTLRAVSQYMTVIEEARALFEVVSESGNTYTVDLQEPACTCPDFRHREEVKACKHIRRVQIEVGQVDIHRLETQLTETAEDLEESADQLRSKAEELTETATDLERARDRLQAVTAER